MIEPTYRDDSVTFYAGDCLDLLAELPDASVDAVVTDPPYGLGFMGHEWDQPGEFGALRSNGQPARTQREAPFDHQNTRLRDGAMEAGRYDLSHSANARFQAWCQVWAAQCLRVLKPGGYLVASGSSRTAHRLTCAIEDAGFEIRDSIAWLYGSGFPKSMNVGDGRGTALKPAFEPITMGRKPLIGTVVENLAAHGTGALNIDACRIATDDVLTGSGTPPLKFGGQNSRPFHETAEPRGVNQHVAGRWPANVALDESQAAALDEQAGTLTSGANPTRRSSDKFRDTYGEFKGQTEIEPNRGTDSGGASRFYYVAKASTSERPRADDGTAHPTVKPLSLMRWLVRLVTPPGGLVLDPFLGSGTTAEACVIEGYRCIGIERHEPYLQLAIQRLGKPIQPDMFGASA
jgi:DNA modification methylase